MRFVPGLIIFLLFSFFQASGQYNNMSFYSSHFSSQGSLTQPALLGENIKSVDFNFLSTYVWAGNNAFDFSVVRGFFKNHVIDGLPVPPDFFDKMLTETKPRNTIGAGADIVPFLLTLNFGKKEKDLLSIALSYRARPAFSFTLSDNVMRLAIKGNSQFRGEEIDLGPVRFNLLAMDEIGFAIAAPIRIPIMKTFSIKPVIRFKYLNIYAGIYTERSNISFYTAGDGSEIKLNADYEYYAAIPDGTKNYEGKPIAPFDGLGYGLGIDLGGKMQISDHFSAMASVIDIGYLNFHDSTRVITSNQEITFKGVKIDLLNMVQNQEIAVMADTYDSLLNPDITRAPVRIPLGTKLILQGEYRFGRSLTAGKDEKEFFKNHIFFTYIQSFRYLVNASLRPYFSVGYMHSLGNVINIGGSASYGGFNNLAVGPFFSIKMGPFRLGIGSNNMLPIFYDNTGTGFDLSYSMSVSI